MQCAIETTTESTTRGSRLNVGYKKIEGSRGGELRGSDGNEQQENMDRWGEQENGKA